MSNTQKKHVSRSKGYRLEKAGIGPHHGRFCLVNVARVLPPTSPVLDFLSRSGKRRPG